MAGKGFWNVGENVSGFFTTRKNPEIRRKTPTYSSIIHRNKGAGPRLRGSFIWRYSTPFLKIYFTFIIP